MTRPSVWQYVQRLWYPAAIGAFIGAGLVALVGRTQIRDTPGSVEQRLGYERLSVVAVAMHAAAEESEDGATLPTDICDDQGRPLLSWRVKILPHLKEVELYRRFRLNEPWDSLRNQDLAGQTPETFQIPGMKAPPGHTYYKVFTGPGGWFGKPRQANLNRVPDGLFNTIMIVTGGDSVLWTKPEDIPYHPDRPLPNLALPRHPDYTRVAMGDRSVRSVSLKTVSEKSIRAAITWNANDTLGPDW